MFTFVSNAPRASVKRKTYIQCVHVFETVKYPIIDGLESFAFKFF